MKIVEVSMLPVKDRKQKTKGVVKKGSRDRRHSKETEKIVYEEQIHYVRTV